MQTDSSARWHLLRGKIVTPSGILHGGSLTLAGGKIEKISRRIPPPHRRESSIDAGGNWVIPGLIDLHVNGVGPCDLSRDPAAALEIFSEEMARRGVTSFLPALISAPFPELLQTLQELPAAFRRPMPGARPLGIHLEGPFLNPRRRGAHPLAAIQPVSLKKAKKLWEAGEGLIKMMTVAPEKEGAGRLLQFLRQKKILAAMGHTDATYAEGIQAIARGCRYATHLFNAMRPWHHRDPGVAQAILDSPGIFAELICDGVHVSYPVLEAVLRLKSKEKIVLASDELVGASAGNFFAGKKLQRRGNRLVASGGKTIAGGALSLLEGICHWSQKAKRNWIDLIPLATINPSSALGISRTCGSLEAGKRADLVVLDKNLKPVMTVVAGKIVYR